MPPARAKKGKKVHVTTSAIGQFMTAHVSLQVRTPSPLSTDSRSGSETDTRSTLDDSDTASSVPSTASNVAKKRKKPRQPLKPALAVSQRPPAGPKQMSQVGSKSLTARYVHSLVSSNILPA